MSEQYSLWGMKPGPTTPKSWIDLWTIYRSVRKRIWFLEPDNIPRNRKTLCFPPKVSPLFKGSEQRKDERDRDYCVCVWWWRECDLLGKNKEEEGEGLIGQKWGAESDSTSCGGLWNDHETHATHSSLNIA